MYPHGDMYKVDSIKKVGLPSILSYYFLTYSIQDWETQV